MNGMTALPMTAASIPSILFILSKQLILFNALHPATIPRREEHQPAKLSAGSASRARTAAS